MKYKCCKPVFFKHDMGWDIYKQGDCYLANGHFVPTWFDCAVVEDCETKKQAEAELATCHVLGLCLA